MSYMILGMLIIFTRNTGGKYIYKKKKIFFLMNDQ